MSGLNYGRKYTLSMSEKPLNHNGNPKKKVYQLDKNENVVQEYISVRDCAEKTGINRATLITWIKKSSLSKEGFYFSYNKYINKTIKLI